MRPLRVLTWHVHGSYLAALAEVPVTWYLPVRPGRPSPYGGRGASFDWPANVVEVDAGDVRRLALDCVVHQSRATWERDRFELLTAAQRRLPAVYVEHDPPREAPCDTRHPVDDPDVLVVHVTAFNRLMWDTGRTPTTVVEHGVRVPDGVRATYELPRAVTALNHPARRGRRVGFDLLARWLAEGVPVDLVGMGTEDHGGLGEVPPRELSRFEARYRAFLHPVRWTSLGMAVCEAMLVGLPVVGLACTELVSVVEDGVTGWTATDPAAVAAHVRRLAADPAEAARLGTAAREVARDRFGIDRFVRDWTAVLHDASGRPARIRAGRPAAPTRG